MTLKLVPLSQKRRKSAYNRRTHLKQAVKAKRAPNRHSMRPCRKLLSLDLCLKLRFRITPRTLMPFNLPGCINHLGLAVIWSTLETNYLYLTSMILGWDLITMIEHVALENRKDRAQASKNLITANRISWSTWYMRSTFQMKETLRKICTWNLS